VPRYIFLLCPSSMLVKQIEACALACMLTHTCTQHSHTASISQKFEDAPLKIVAHNRPIHMVLFAED